MSVSIGSAKLCTHLCALQLLTSKPPGLWTAACSVYPRKGLPRIPSADGGFGGSRRQMSIQTELARTKARVHEERASHARDADQTRRRAFLIGSSLAALRKMEAASVRHDAIKSCRADREPGFNGIRLSTRRLPPHWRTNRRLSPQRPRFDLP